MIVSDRRGLNYIEENKIIALPAPVRIDSHTYYVYIHLPHRDIIILTYEKEESAIDAWNKINKVRQPKKIKENISRFSDLENLKPGYQLITDKKGEHIILMSEISMVSNVHKISDNTYYLYVALKGRPNTILSYSTYDEAETIRLFFRKELYESQFQKSEENFQQCI